MFLLEKYKGLIAYATFNYIDKFFSFILPLSVLYFYPDRQAYNDVEYIFSIASIAVVLIELGFKTYFFYGYRDAGDREEFVQKIKLFFTYLLRFYVVVGFFVVCLCYYYNVGFRFLLVLSVIRTLYILVISFYGVYYRLVDRPSLIFCFSVTINVLSVVCLFAAFFFGSKFPLYALFLPEFVLLLIVSCFYRRNYGFCLKDFSVYVFDALSYSWPIILNVLFVSYMNNYAKIYAYNYMEPDDMFKFSLLMRVSLIIQMMHVSISGYFSKSIFVNDNQAFDFKIFTVYMVSMLSSSFLVLVLLGLLGTMFPRLGVSLDLTAVLVILYILLWCFQAYFEIYLGKHKRTKYIFAFSLFSVLIFLSLIFFIGVSSVVSLVLYMLVSVTVNLFLTLLFLRYNVFKVHE